MMSRRAAARTEIPLDRSLVLFSFLADQFAIPLDRNAIPDLGAFKTLTEDVAAENYTKVLENQESLNPDLRQHLSDYDNNIREHTEKIGRRRGGDLQWEYFQWLILMFSERCLHLWFHDKDALLRDLDEHRHRRFLRLSRYDESDLARLALWSATGSGKTLMMHINLLQFRRCLEKYRRDHDISQEILLVPNDGLALQHLAEFRDSGIAARVFDKRHIGGFRRGEVEIVSIHKIRDDDATSREGETVPVSAFESKNLVMIDEGHRGHSGEKWLRYRAAMTGRGFSFEYSATFGQIKDAGKRYARSILFDYSYRRFYDDEYGKDFKIFNLNSAGFENQDDRRKYLTACLLAFYLQMKTYESDDKWRQEHNIEKPLLVFVGARVNAVRTENRAKVSDVLDAVIFLNGILSDPEQTRADIRGILRNGDSLQDADGNPIFGDLFSPLKDDPREIYADLLAKVFQSDSSASLHLEKVADADGEIALRAGVAEPFGVINIGDVTAFLKLCAQHLPDAIADDRNFSGSLFRRINEPNSRVSVLIGSKKFTEGWNSWRVSTMGLLNVGKSEGTEIIQLFGRGIRLHGKDNDLKRQINSSDSGVKTLETLNIFGLRANFIAEFKEYLRREGLDDQKPFTIPVTVAEETLDSRTFPIVKTEKNEDGFREEVSVLVKHSDGRDVDEVQFAMRMSVSSMTSARESESGEGARIRIPPQYKAFFDRAAIQEALLRHKRVKGWYNLVLDDRLADDLLENDDWYSLSGDPADAEGLDWEKLRHWQSIAADMMKQYVTNFRRRELREWAAANRKYARLDKSHGNFISKYEVRVDKQNKHLMDSIGEIIKGKPGYAGLTAPDTSNLHLYKPLLALKNSIPPREARVIPGDARLNDGEKNFLEALLKWWDKKGRDRGMEIFLLRNRSRGHGVGFIEYGFYQDFIMWLFADDRRHIAFIDPKGLVHSGPASDKVKFGDYLREKIEPALREKSGREFSDCRLHYFLVSQTPKAEVEKMYSELPGYVLYPEDEGYIEDMISRIIGERDA